MRALLATLYALTGLYLAASGHAAAHEGHDHANESPVISSALPRGSAASAALELVGVLRSGQLSIYLDRFQTNEPVLGASVEIETPDGSVQANEVEGVYRLPAAWAVPGGHYDLIATVVADGNVEILPFTIDVPKNAQVPASASSNFWSSNLGLGSLALVLILVAWMAAAVRRRHTSSAALSLLIAVVATLSSVTFAIADEGHGDETSKGAAVLRDAPQRQNDGSVFVPKSSQRLLAIRTVVTAKRTYFKATELPGRIISDPNASGYVQSALAGRLSPPPQGFPALGSRVEKGQVLAYVAPPIQAVDISDMRQKEGELLQQISIVERRVARYEQLIKTEAVARAQLDDARLELKGLLERKAALDQSRREPEALIAPVSGVIAAANTIAGQLAQPNAVIFEIVDTTRLWVEALTFEPIAPGVQGSVAAGNGRSIKLSYRGAGLAGRNQAIPVHFAIDGPTSGLWAGQFVTVFASANDSHEGIAVPRSAVVRASNGMHIVYVHTSAEAFEPREVRIAPLDGEQALVLAGLDEGQRIVAQGAELLDQVR